MPKLEIDSKLKLIEATWSKKHSSYACVSNHIEMHVDRPNINSPHLNFNKDPNERRSIGPGKVVIHLPHLRQSEFNNREHLISFSCAALAHVCLYAYIFKE